MLTGATEPILGSSEHTAEKKRGVQCGVSGSFVSSGPGPSGEDGTLAALARVWPTLDKSTRRAILGVAGIDSGEG